MVQAYNFLASWQLFPEKCVFEKGTAPKSGNYKVETDSSGKYLSISINWVSLENEAFYTQFNVIPNDELLPFDNQDLADSYVCSISNASTLKTIFYKNEKTVLEVVNEILANGYMKVTQTFILSDDKVYKNVEVYHKQLSVLPYASSVSGVAIRPTKEGMIKHKALAAMDEQTNMQLNQIKEQIELLARQAQEIRKRKELSLMIYEAKLSFKPQIGQTYYLYERKDGTHLLSLVAPQEWGGSGPYKQFLAAVQLLADHTWKEMLS